jgi:hypothetical protein
MNARDDEIARLRVPPHSAEAEMSLLGALLVDNAAMSLVAELLIPASFYSLANRQIYCAIESLYRDGEPADPTTVFERMERDGDSRSEVYDPAGGLLPYLEALQQSVATSRNARRYAQIIADKAAERALMAGCDEAMSIALAPGVAPSDKAELIAAVFARVEQQRKTPGRRLPLLKLDALQASAESVRWLVKHVVPAESVGIMYGGSGTFKSFIALDFALHVAHGLPWMGRRTRRGAVLYIAAEGGSGLWKRIEAWHAQRHLSWEDAPIFVVPIAVDLVADAWRVVDAAQMLGVSPACVIVDTLSQTFAGEENSAAEVTAYLREIGLRFRQVWQAAVLLIHHTGHQATERPRGSSAIRANVDFMLGVSRDGKEMLATIECQKQKDGELFSDATFSLSVARLGVDADGEPVTTLVARHLSSAEEVELAAAAEVKAGRGGRGQMLLSVLQNGMTVHALRKAFVDACDGLSEDAKRQAYSRALAWAKKGGFLEISQGVVITLKPRS